jgi:hypothetical protein
MQYAGEEAFYQIYMDILDLARYGERKQYCLGVCKNKTSLP